MTTLFTLHPTPGTSRFGTMALVGLGSLSGLQGGRCERFTGIKTPKSAELTGDYQPWSLNAQSSDSDSKSNRLHHNSLFSTVRDNWELPQA